MSEKIPSQNIDVLNTTLEKLDHVKMELLQGEVVVNRQMTDIVQSPLVDQVIKEIDGENVGSLFVGAVRQRTFEHKIKGTSNTIKSGWVSGQHDGRCLRHQFDNGPVLFPKIDSIDETGRIVLSQTEFVPFQGVDVKGGGITYAFASEGHGAGPARRREMVGVLSPRKSEFVPQGHGEWWGSNDHRRRVGEYNLLAKLAARGARVDYPVVVARNNDPSFPSNDLGLISRLYRTPFTFLDILDTGGRRPDMAIFLMLDGIKVWRDEGLVGDDEIRNLDLDIDPTNEVQFFEKNRKLIRFYVTKGAEISGRDLAIIHQVKSLGNRNPQNMGNEFGHRDVYDGDTFEASESNGKNVGGKIRDKKENFTNKLNGMWESVSKLSDVLDDLRQIMNVTRRLDPRMLDELIPIVVNTFLKNYLRQEKGLTKREMGKLALIGGISEMIDSKFFLNFDRNQGLAKIIFREYGNVIKELESGK